MSHYWICTTARLLQCEQSEHALAFKTQDKCTLFVPGQNYLLLWLSEKDKYCFSSEQLDKEKKILACGLRKLICVSRLRVRSFYYAMQFPLFLSTDNILTLYNTLKSVLSISSLFFLLKIGAIGYRKMQVYNLYWRTCICCTLLTKMSDFPKCLTTDTGLYKTMIYALNMESPLNLHIWPEGY